MPLEWHFARIFLNFAANPRDKTSSRHGWQQSSYTFEISDIGAKSLSSGHWEGHDADASYAAIHGYVSSSHSDVLSADVRNAIPVIEQCAVFDPTYAFPPSTVIESGAPSPICPGQFISLSLPGETLTYANLGDSYTISATADGQSVSYDSATGRVTG